MWNSCRAISVHPGCLALLKAEVKNQGVELELGLADRFAGLEVQVRDPTACNKAMGS